MIKTPKEPTYQQLQKANLCIKEVTDKNKTFLVLALVVEGQVIYRFYECQNRGSAKLVKSPYPEIFRKSYTIGDVLPKNIAAEIYHLTKNAVIKLNEQYSSQS